MQTSKEKQPMNTVAEHPAKSSEIDIRKSKKDLIKQARDLSSDALSHVDELAVFFQELIDSKVDQSSVFDAAVESAYRLKAVIYMIEERLWYVQPSEDGYVETCFNCVTKMVEDWWDRNCADVNHASNELIAAPLVNATH